MKFEDAFCTAIGKVISIGEAKDMFVNDRLQFISVIKDTLICPECREPKLSYNNALTPYFSVHPNAQHLEGCSLKQDEMTMQQARDFLYDNINDAVIKRQMDNLITLLLSDNSNATLLGKSIPSVQVLASSAAGDKTSVLTKRRIPRKRIDMPFREIDFKCEKLFYGRIHLKWEKGEKERYKILLYPTDGKNLLCKLSISQSVYKYLNDEYKNPDAFDCAIAFAANFNNLQKAYQMASLRSSKRISLIKLSRSPNMNAAHQC